MSETILYKFNKKGYAQNVAEFKNGHRSAAAVWYFLEEKYLPKIQYGRMRNSRYSFEGKEGMFEVWDLVKTDKLTRDEKIVLLSTFDYSIVMKENFPELIKAYNSFEGNTSLKEQALEIEKLLNDEDTVAVGWNQISVNWDDWSNYGQLSWREYYKDMGIELELEDGYKEEDIDDDDSEMGPIPYNVLKESHKHYNIFEEDCLK